MGGDPTFEELFRREYPPIHRTVALIVGNPETAHEVTQEAFTQLHLKWNRVARYERPGAWVRRVAIRLAVRRRRRAETGALLEQLAVVPPVRNDSVDPDVLQAIHALPARQRAAIVLRYFADLDMKAIAEALGCTEATARSHLHKARITLARTLADHEGGVTDVAR